VVPLPIDPTGKKPLVRQPGKFGIRAVQDIFSKFPNAELGFYCGRRNGLTVVDVDDARDTELQRAIDTYGNSPIIVETASGKHHLYYRYDGERRSIRPDKEHAIDILGEGGICIAPPSVRNDGAYRFERGGLSDLANLPTIRRQALADLVPTLSHRTENPVSGTSAEVIYDGTRNAELATVARYIASGLSSLDEHLTKVREANAALCKPPLDDDEVRKIARSAWRYKIEGRLMVPGMASAILLPRDDLDQLLRAGETDALALLAQFRKAHIGRRNVFAASPKALERDRLIGSWNHHRYRNATRKLCELDFLEKISNGGKGPNDPALYSFKKGYRFGPQY